MNTPSKRAQERTLRRAALVLSAWSAAAVALRAQTADPTCTIDVSRPGAAVAPICQGQQIEEFNYQFEGGLYAQLLRNPSFEELNDPLTGWTLVMPGSSRGSLSAATAADTGLLNDRQKHCAKLASGTGAGLANAGYWGIGLKDQTTYKVSFWAKREPNFEGTVEAALESNEGKVCARSQAFKPTTSWRHFTCDLTTQGITQLTGSNRFVLYASSAGTVYFDVVTLMPRTWKDRPNGLRPDLGGRLAALQLKYI
jgi:alpha-N-arabinofuranosidase